MAGTATTTLDLGANDLTISSGGITTVATNITQNITSTTGGLIAANNELIVHANTSGTNGLNISALIKDNGANAVTLTKSGAQTLTLSGANSYSGGTVLNAGTITIASDGNLGAVPGVATAGNLILNGGTLNTTATMTLNANRGIQLNGVVGISPNANTTLSMAGNITGNGVITKNTAGSTLILSGTNNFSGPAFGDLGPLTAGLVLNGGKVVLANTAALGASGNSIGLSTGANSSLEIATDSAVNTHGLQMSSNNAGTIILSRATPGAAYNQPFAMSALGNNVLNVLPGSNITSGTPSISIAGLNLTAGNAGAMTLKPVGTTISVTGSVFIGSNNYAKTLALDGTSTGNLVSANLFDGGIGSALSLAKSNSSTWTLSSANNTFTGTTSVTGGTLRLDYSTNNTSKLADAAALTLGGGTLDLAGGSHMETVGSTILTANTTSKVTHTSGSGVLQMNTITANNGALVNFAGDNIASTDTLNNTTTGILGPWATVTNAGVTDWAINSTNGADGLITAYSGYANIDQLAGSVPNTAAANVRITEGGSSGNITLAAGTTQINTLKMEASGGPGVIALAGQTLSVGGNTGGTILLDAGAGALTIGSAADDGTLTTGATADATPATLRFTNMSSANALRVNSAINNNGTDVVSIATSGPGKVTLAGTNTFTGTVKVDEGELELANAAALPTAATVNVASSGTLNLNGNSVTISNLGGDTTGIVTDKSGGAGTTSITISTVQGNPAIRQIFSDGPSKKIQVVLYNGNADSRVLDNPLNTFSGGLVLGQNSSGTRLVMTTTPQTTGTAGALTNGIYGTGPIIVGQAATDKAGIFINGNGVTVLNDVTSNTAAGTDRVGTFRIDTVNNVLAGTLTAGEAPMALSTNGTGSVTVSGKVTGTNGFQLLSHSQQTATMSLSATLANTGAANDYQGDTIINQSAVADKSFSLLLGAADQIPNGTGKGNLVVNTATTGVGTLNLNGFSETINGLSGNGTVTSATVATLTVGDNDATGAANTFSGTITGAAALTKTGDGILTLSGTNTYSGATNITGGLLEVATGGSLAAESAVTVSNSGSQFIVNGTVNGSLQVNASTTLSGSGTIKSATIDGILAPGNSIGTLNAAGDVTWNDNEAWVFELGSAASTLALAGSGSSIQDMLNITGNFNKGSGTSFTFNFGGVADNGYYKLVDWTGTTGFASGDFFASNLASGQSGSFIVDTDTSALYLNVIPEPGAAVLSTLGTLALLRRRRSA